MSWVDPTLGPHGRQGQDGRIRRAFASVARRLSRVRVEDTAEATTLGTVTHRIPVHDADGVLVGYLPLYDDIT